MKVAGHEILLEIGRGSMGVVYRARSSDGRDLAIKVLRDSGADAVERFEREERLLLALGEEAGFVPVLESGLGPSGHYLVMPFLEGGTLRDRLGAPLGVDRTVALGVVLATALGRAHAAGIVHRDVKPENILFRGDRPLIADLGIAKHFRWDAPGASQSVALSREYEFRGTAGYAAPEQVQDAKEVGSPADVFALGVILLECLLGKPVYPSRSTIDYLLKIEAGAREAFDALPSAVPPGLRAALARALSKDPGARFIDGHAFARALEAGAGRAPGARRWTGLVAFAACSALACIGLARGRPHEAATSVPAASPGERLVLALEPVIRLEEKPGAGEALARDIIAGEAPAARAEAAGLLAKRGSAGFAARDWRTAAALGAVVRLLDPGGELGPEPERVRLASVALLGRPDLAALGKMSPAELAAPPLDLACAALFSGALAYPPPDDIVPLTKLVSLPPAPFQRPLVGRRWLEEAARRAPLIESAASVGDYGQFFETGTAVMGALARANAADASIGAFPKELDEFFGSVRSFWRNFAEPEYADRWRAAFAAFPEHPTYLYIVGYTELRPHVREHVRTAAESSRAIDLVTRSLRWLDAGSEESRGLARRLAIDFLTAQGTALDPGMLEVFERLAIAANDAEVWHLLGKEREGVGDEAGAGEAFARWRALDPPPR